MPWEGADRERETPKKKKEVNQKTDKPREGGAKGRKKQGGKGWENQDVQTPSPQVQVDIRNLYIAKKYTEQ